MIKLIKFLFIFELFFMNLMELNAKVLVITHAYKRPDFIEIQHKTFQKFLKDDYEFVVFNDAKDEKTFRKINFECSRLSIKCIPIPQEIHKRPYLYREPGELYDHPCVTCANVVQYSLDTLGFLHDDLVMIIDSDMFLLKEFSISDYLRGYSLSGFPQSRSHITYLWNGLVFLDMKILSDKTDLNFNCGKVEGQSCDVGGYTYHYIKKHPEVSLKFVPKRDFVFDSMNSDKEKLHPFMRLLVDKKCVNSEFFIDYTFFHYRGGGNWDHKSPAYHRDKTKCLHDLIDLAMEG